MSFIFNGVSSDTMKFNVTSRQVYNAPAYDLNAIEVPGRSGDLLNPQNRFKNKQVTYTGFLKASDFEGSTWREKLSTGLIQLKGWLCSDAGQYHELTDDYDPGFTRYGYISGETAISDIEDRPFGVTLTVTFNCKPYMYKAGEPMELPETKSASGEIITITDGAENTPLKSAVVNIEPVQSGSGDPSPTNIRPISGWTGVNVVAAGANLLPLRSGSTTQNGQTFTPTDGTLVINGTASANSALYLKDGTTEGNKIYLPAGTYVVSGFEDYDDVNTYVGVNINSTSGAYTATSKSGTHTFTVVEGDYVFPRARIASGAVMDNYVLQPMIRRTSDASAFAPYQGTPVTVSLGQTVYGGTLDVVKGKLVVDRGYTTITAFSSKSGTTANQVYAYQGISGTVKKASADTATVDILSDKFVKSHFGGAGGLYGTDKLGIAVNTNGTVYVGFGKDGVSTLADANTWVAANPIQVVYPLATPIEVDLTPQTIKTLLGTNNIWADAGSMAIEYLIPTENPYPFGSRPLYEITMAGTGTLVVNGKEWTITQYTGTLYCDTEAMEWYDASQLRNNIVSGDGWPVFEAGENSVSYTGDITKVMVTPRWRTL